MLRFEHIVCNVSRHLEADLRVFTGVSSRRDCMSSKVATAAVGVTGEYVEEAVKIVSSGSGVARCSVEGPACSPFNFVRNTHDPSMRSSPNTFWINSFLSWYSLPVTFFLCLKSGNGSQQTLYPLPPTFLVPLMAMQKRHSLSLAEFRTLTGI